MVATSQETDNIVEIEIDGPRNESCVFRPLQRRIRGRFDLRRVAEPKAMLLHPQHPDPIPGQRLRLNIAAGTAVRFEPGDEREVELVPIGGNREVWGLNGLVNGRLDDETVRQRAMSAVEGFRRPAP